MPSLKRPKGRFWFSELSLQQLDNLDRDSFYEVMVLKRHTIWIIFSVCLLICCSVVGCSNQESSAKKPAQEGGQPEIPSDFEKIVSDTESIILQSDMKWKMRQPSKLQQSTPIEEQEGQQGQTGQNQAGQSQQGEQQQSGSEGGQGEQGGQGGQGGSGQAGGQGQQGSQQTGQQEGKTSTVNWESETKSLMSIHKSWNSLQADAMKAGMSNAVKDSFDKALDRLTTEINSQNDIGTLLAAIDLYGQFDEIATLFKGDIPPSFYETKYQVILVTALGQQGDWEAAKPELADMKDLWGTLKMQSQNADPNTVSRTEIAIQDLARAVESEYRELVMIKGEIAVADLMKLQEELKSKKIGQQ